MRAFPQEFAVSLRKWQKHKRHTQSSRSHQEYYKPCGKMWENQYVPQEVQGKPDQRCQVQSVCFRKASGAHETEIGSEGFVFVTAKPSTRQKMA